jgi:hypothetical protein
MIERWIQTLQSDPQGAIEALMSGRAGVGADLRLDIPELLHHLFADGADRANERERLDTALYNWLLAMKSDYTPKVDRLGFASYGRRLIDALVTLRLLDLPIAREHIRRDLDAWIRWLAPLRLAPERDPALECWRLLAEGQRDQALVAAWLRLAADPRPEYLDAALSGLERVPTGGEIAINRVLMLRAVLTHAVRRPGAAGEAKSLIE